VLGIVLLVVFAWQIGIPAGNAVASVQKGYPAAGTIHAGDQLVAVDGRRGTPTQLSDLVAADRCPQQPPVKGCRGAHPVTVTVKRGAQLVTFKMTPVYDPATKRMRLGFTYDPNGGPRQPYSFSHAVSASTTAFGRIAKVEVTLPARILNPKDRKQIHGIVGTTEITRQTILHDPADVVQILAVISIALAIVNLFPFLPLDGGHIFWALVELIRRRPVAFSTMERSGVIGFALVILLFAIGLTNDISSLQNGGFKVR
jgi:regulator of sigma E protease